MQVSWNTFECTIVAISLLELCLVDVEGLSVLRAFRLVSVHLFTLTFFVTSPVSLCPHPSSLWFPCLSVPLPPRLDVSFLCFVQLRVFRLARSWRWFHQFLQITLRFSFLLLIVFLGFVTIGYQLFHKDYRTSVCKISHDCMLPRWHMDSFFHTFLIVFGIFSGSWIEKLWDCMEVSGPALCLTFYVSVVIIGNLLVSLRE